MAAPPEAVPGQGATDPPTTDATTTPTPTTTTTPSTLKPIHSLVLDTGPLIKNDPPVDVLRARAEMLYILPSVIPEIRDQATRSRVETTLLPFLTLRSPKPESVKFIQGFARRTGDLQVLSRPDIEVLALGYELECERNGGDWRLRSTPGQKTLNGRPPQKDGAPATEEPKGDDTQDDAAPATDNTDEVKTEEEPAATQDAAEEASLDKGIEKLHIEATGPNKDATTDSETLQVEAHNIAHEATPTNDLASQPLTSGEKADESLVVTEAAEEDDAAASDDEGGWITPSNLKKHKEQDSTTSSLKGSTATITLQAAILTSDYAMQNVALRMNLNLVSPQMTRISKLRTWVLRCHACFQITRAMEKRFCPSCGQPTLLRAACTVDDKTGALTVHLKKNFQWNNRGNVYSVPKPVHGTSNGRAPKGSSSSNGGVGGWGRDLILAEDQKEFVKASDEQRREAKKTMDVMDQDYLPSILGGDRSRAGGRIRVGAGRNVNSKKKKR